MTSKELLVVKLGGSVVTDKSKKFTINHEAVSRLADELVSARDPFILIHGGGSFGHPLASKFDIGSGYKERGQLMGFSLTHWAMEVLNSEVVDALREAGFPSMAIQPSACTIVEDGRIVSMELEPIRKSIKMGLTPVLYGDSVLDLERGMSILSGDQLAVYLARELDASRIVIGADIDGVYIGETEREEGVEPLPKITPGNWEVIASSIGPASTTDVTGGMSKKVEELLRLGESGIEAQIVNASKPGILKRAIQGDKSLGTRVVGE